MGRSIFLNPALAISKSSADAVALMKLYALAYFSSFICSNCSNVRDATEAEEIIEELAKAIR